MDPRKTPVGGSDDGGDKKTPMKTLKKTHIAYTPIKIKINLSSVEINALEVQESPHAMDMDEIIEEPGWFMERLLETIEIVDPMMTRDPEIFEEESFTMHHVTYNCETKKLLLEKVNTKKKNSLERWKYSIDLDGVAPSKIVYFHGATRDALRQSIDNLEKENSKLKKKDKIFRSCFGTRTIISRTFGFNSAYT